jgi:hypothetical protein
LFINLTTQFRLNTNILTRKGTLGALWKMLTCQNGEEKRREKELEKTKK